ncbi:MAG: precorrin-8X methylmutase [Candidatus Hydrothermarchaeaceae archaeon]
MESTRLDEGKRIEDESFQYIDARITMPYPEGEITKRVVHATADLSFADVMVFKGDAVVAGIEAIKNGGNVVTDVKMVSAGVNAQELRKFGGEVKCFIDEKDTRALASEERITRSRAAFRVHAEEIRGNIIAVGNAPTALLELCRLVEMGLTPALIIAVPVGFVGAREAKERILEFDVPCIAVRGERGGSPVAASIVNAIISLSKE